MWHVMDEISSFGEPRGPRVHGPSHHRSTHDSGSAYDARDGDDLVRYTYPLDGEPRVERKVGWYGGSGIEHAERPEPWNERRTSRSHKAVAKAKQAAKAARKARRKNR